VNSTGRFDYRPSF